MKKKQLMDLVALGEGFTTEFKRSGTSSLGWEICAFANATGGGIIIGVTDSGEKGFQNLTLRYLSTGLYYFSATWSRIR